MNGNFSNVKKIDQQYKDIVIGFIRELNNQLTSNHFVNIPLEIIYLCLLFYWNDEFDPLLCGKYLKLSENNKKLSAVQAKWNTCYGKIIINPSINGLYIWKIKIVEPDTNGLVIGIDNAKGKYANDYFWDKKETGSYNWHAWGGQVRSWNKSNKDHSIYAKNVNDIIIMKLEFNSNSHKGILSFKVNKKKFIAADDVPRDKELRYRLAITMLSTSCAVQLV